MSDQKNSDAGYNFTLLFFAVIVLYAITIPEATEPDKPIKDTPLHIRNYEFCLNFDLEENCREKWLKDITPSNNPHDAKPLD